jgi:hypothetical protein
MSNRWTLSVSWNSMFFWLCAETTDPSSSLKSSAIGTKASQRGLFPEVADFRASALQHYKK